MRYAATVVAALATAGKAHSFVSNSSSGARPSILRTSNRMRSGAALTMGLGIEDVLKNPKWPEQYPFKPADFKRQDESVDTEFYEYPRLVLHIDDAAVKALTEYYSKTLPEGADVLDICSSWVSHFPQNWKHGKRVGLGMNEYELSQNKQLDEYVVRDLNVNPAFPFPDSSFDVITCVVSIDYLVTLDKVFAEAARVLRPNGKFIISMSNRCFPTKAWKLWLSTNDFEHVFIVGAFFHYSGAFQPAQAHDISPNPSRSDPMYIVEAVVKK